MTLSERLSEYIAACFSGIWIESHEHPDALMEIGRLCQRENWRLACWDIERGLRLPGSGQPADVGGNDPLAAIRSINALAGPDSSAVLVLANFHRFMQSAEIVEALAQQVGAGKQNRTFVIVLAPVVDVPVELEKLFVVVEHDLPSREQLLEIAQGIATEEGELPEDDELETVLDAAAGLTRYEAEGAFALSLVRHHRIAPQSVWSIKAQQLKKSGLLQLHRGAERFDNLGDGPGCEYRFDADDRDGERGTHLWLFGAEGADLERVVHLVQRFLETFRPGDCWSLTYAITCSKPRVGEFGGGAVFVTASETMWDNSHDFVERSKRRFLSNSNSEACDEEPCRPSS